VQTDVTRDFSVAAADGALLRVREFTARPGADDVATVVLAHGWTLTHASWLPVVEQPRASTGARVVVYDQRGHGASTAAPGLPSVRTLGDDLAAVLAVSAPAGPMRLRGHSMGLM
jgi:pimeloyl-ACP methyl ester carboxylesterase